jgi:hypothetical protein
MRSSRTILAALTYCFYLCYFFCWHANCRCTYESLNCPSALLSELTSCDRKTCLTLHLISELGTNGPLMTAGMGTQNFRLEFMANAPCLKSVSWYKKHCTEKGKPVERQGRKASGLRVFPRTAGPPETEMLHASSDPFPRAVLVLREFKPEVRLRKLPVASMRERFFDWVLATLIVESTRTSKMRDDRTIERIGTKFRQCVLTSQVNIAVEPTGCLCKDNVARDM